MKNKRKFGGKSGAKARLLENSIGGLRHLGFSLFRNKNGFKQSQSCETDSYIVTNFPHDHLYGLSGKKEAFISHNGNEYIFEAKYQDCDGTTDEKLPLVWESFLASPIQNWIIRFDGAVWKSRRGQAGIAWLRNRATQCPKDRTFHVIDSEDQWCELVERLFK